MGGGRLTGEQVGLSARTLNENRHLPVLTEYRALLDGIFERMYGLDAARVQRVFPNSPTRDLGRSRSSDSADRDRLS